MHTDMLVSPRMQTWHITYSKRELLVVRVLFLELGRIEFLDAFCCERLGKRLWLLRLGSILLSSKLRRLNPLK